MSKKFSYTAALSNEYQLMFDQMVIRATYLSTVQRVVAKMKTYRAQYDIVSSIANIPWYVVGIIHYLESDFNFNTHLFNGDPLSAVTVNQPIGYPKVGNPPFPWSGSALLALQRKDIWNIGSSDIPKILYLLEGYNGTGYRHLRRYGYEPIPTPYLWSYSTYYIRGKFVHDGIKNYNPNFVSNQVGAAPLLKVLLQSNNVTVDDGNVNQTVNSVAKQLIPRVDYATYTNNLEQSVQNFLNINEINMTPAELIAYRDNSKKIFKSYNTQQSFQYKTAVPDLIGISAKITAPYNKLSAKSVYIINQTLVENTDYTVFIESEIRKLLNNPKYIRLNVDETAVTPQTALFKRQDKFTIWVWCKSFSPNGDRLFDLSPFAESVTINTTKNGSNWNVTLPHITYFRDKDGNFILNVDQYNTQSFDNNFVTKNNTSHRENFSRNAIYQQNRLLDDNQEITNTLGEGFMRRDQSLFVDLIQSNDVIFIRLEPLEMDDQIQELALRDNNYTLPSDVLPGKVFDLIGLVDSNPMSIKAENSDQSVVLSGRCLSKLLIDDGVYFFPVEYAVKDREQIIKNSTKTKSGIRLFLPDNNATNAGGIQKNVRYLADDGSIIGDTQFNFDKTQSVEEWIVFIMSQLSNITTTPENLFKQYANKTFIVNRDGDIKDPNQSHYKTVLASGIWQIIKLVVDGKIVDRKIADNSLATDTGSLLNLIQKVCQAPFVEFYMDTYGDKFYFIVRKPPFTFESFKSNFCINIFEHDVISDTLTYATDEIYTWYKINPFTNIFGYDDDSGFMTLFPAIMFPEYVNIWGSKALEINSNFLDFDNSDSMDTKNNFEAIKQQGYADLDWVIETHANLPFTRKGTITIKSDRRIKRGLNIRYFPTGELFYVEAVSQNRTNGFMSNGSTTLTVSHGMREIYLEKYFNIINLQKNKKTNKQEVWTVNKDIFDFFISKSQQKDV